MLYRKLLWPAPVSAHLKARISIKIAIISVSIEIYRTFRDTARPTPVALPLLFYKN